MKLMLFFITLILAVTFLVLGSLSSGSTEKVSDLINNKISAPNVSVEATDKPNTLTNLNHFTSTQGASNSSRVTDSAASSNSQLSPLLGNLNLNNEQLEKVEKISHIFGQKRKTLLKQRKILSPTDYRERLITMRVSFDKNLASILTAKQYQQYLHNTAKLKELREKHIHDHDHDHSSGVKRSKNRMESRHNEH